MTPPPPAAGMPAAPPRWIRPLLRIRRRGIRAALAAALALAFASCEQSPPVSVVIEKEPSLEALVAAVQRGGGTYADVPFRELVELSTGRRVIPVDPSDPVDELVLRLVGEAVDESLRRFNAPGSITNEIGRINEVSSHFEDALLEIIDAMPELSCELPRNAAGNLQRAGYPDLLIRHPPSGRVYYLDPKLVAEGSMTSSLRTFYYTPRGETGKILFDASHLLVGIEHDGNTGQWQFLRWHLVDLSDFLVSLKAEFQASNRDLYRSELIVATGGESDGAGEAEEAEEPGPP